MLVKPKSIVKKVETEYKKKVKENGFEDPKNLPPHEFMKKRMDI